MQKDRTIRDGVLDFTSTADVLYSNDIDHMVSVVRVVMGVGPAIGSVIGRKDTSIK